MSTSMSSTPDHRQQEARTPAALIGLAWTLVGIPLLYGLYQTITRAVALFTG